MKFHQNRFHQHIAAFLFCCALLLSASHAYALVDNGDLVSVSITNGTPMMPRTVFTQTWTMTNTGTSTWTATYNGCTMNIIGNDSLGAVPLFAKTSSSSKHPSAIINSGKSIAPGGVATYSMSFIAPEAPGTYTDTFQLNSAASVFFGPQVTVQIVVQNSGSTNQYDRARVISYANNYDAVVCSDGYFWTNSSGYGSFATNTAVPTSPIGDDCAHFVSCCIGSQTAVRGGGLAIPSRTSPCYGEPGAGRLVNTVLIGTGAAEEVFSLNDMEPGDVVGWNWSGDTNIANLDHVTLYLGNGLLASHAASAVDVSANTWYQSSEPNYVRHLVHIFDAPTMKITRAGNKMVYSWTTNWAGYVLYSSASLAPNATWTKVSTTPATVGITKVVTNTMSGNNLFYRLAHP